MRIEPNRAVGLDPRYILCADGSVVLHDGQSTPRSRLSDTGSAFHAFLGSIDPNTSFVIAIIPDDADRETYFEARRVAASMGIHAQAPVDKPDALREQWETYRRMKNYDSVYEDPEEECEE